MLTDVQRTGSDNDAKGTKSESPAVVSLLDGLGFQSPVWVRGRASIADLFNPDGRTGLYVLHFVSGELYAGKALDVTRRYVQHCHVHSDIERLSFRWMLTGDLNSEEENLVHLLESSHYRLRNIVFASIPPSASDFDLIMHPNEQASWLNNGDEVADASARVVDPDLRRRFSRNYERFRQTPQADAVEDILQAYVSHVIPVPRRSEVSFWSVSCMPKNGVFARVNVYWQEVLTAFLFESELWFSVHCALSPLKIAFGPQLVTLRSPYPLVQHVGHRYQPGGSDQTSFDVPARVAKQFISDNAVVAAARLLNLRLMKKGPCNFGRYHCLDLADRLVESPQD